MKWKYELRDYFTFTRRERIAILVLIAVIVILLMLPGMMLNDVVKQADPADTAWAGMAQKLQSDTIGSGERQHAGRYSNDEPYKAENRSIAGNEVFPFDPNKLDDDGWKKLGVKERTVQTIRRYLEKVGGFRQASDLKKIYGFSPALYEKLEPFIRITPVVLPMQMETKPDASHQPKRYTRIDINLADSAAFEALPGIGSKLAARIVLFRERLGGFFDCSQVGEVYGLHDSVYQKIRPLFFLTNAPVRKIEINKATADELKLHPYFKWQTAKSIVQYRHQHGAFHEPGDLLKTGSIDEVLLQKLTPYLSLVE